MKVSSVFLPVKSPRILSVWIFSLIFLYLGTENENRRAKTKATLTLRERTPNIPSSSTTQIHRLCVLQLMVYGAGWKCYCVFGTVTKKANVESTQSLHPYKNEPNLLISWHVLAKLTFFPQMRLHVFSRNWSLQSWGLGSANNQFCLGHCLTNFSKSEKINSLHFLNFFITCLIPYCVEILSLF